jgi:hypothetical protein
MEAILLDPVPAGIANPALPAGNASASIPSNGLFASLLAFVGGGAIDGEPQDMEGRAASDATAAAALLALLLPQPQEPAPAAAGADAPAIAIDAASLDHQPSPQGLALGLYGLAPGRNDLETVPGKANGLAAEDSAAPEVLLPEIKQGRGETAPANGPAKTVSLAAAAQAQPAISTPLPPELVEETVVESNGLQLVASKAHEAPVPSKPAPAAPAVPATAPAPGDEPRAAETPKPAPQPQTPEPAEPIAEATHDRPYDRPDEPAQARDRDTSPSVTTAYADRPHSLGASTSAHTVVEKLVTLIERPDLLAAHIERAVANGRDRISVALVPADLGRIDIALDFERGGKLSAVIAVDRPQTLELLRRDQSGLERALQDAGFRTDSSSLSFNLRGDQRQQQNPTAPWTPAREPVDPWQSAVRLLPTVSAPARVVAEGRLDIEV